MPVDDNVLDKRKSHRSRHSGRKAEKKKQKKNDENIEVITDKQKNPKAFAFNSAVRAERRFRRKQDINTKKQHIPVIDRTPVEPPPILVAVVGPPKVGKSTLIINLIKSFTKSPLTNIKGPVTIVTGKKRRITIVECNNDINCMIDIAKVADLVLLLCDASFGFEMEIFEFLNICQVHGMPKIMGVLTHLDMLKNSKQLKKTKKTLKHRFWTEVYAGAKLFYLSGIVHGEYLRNEIKNLGRFISVMKFRPLTWRTTHSYILADRYEDLTNLELVRQNKKCDRNVSLYGYVRGIPLNKSSTVHIPGVGDHKIRDISFLPDPCPLPEAIKKRLLVEKERLVYAPFSGVGGIVYDKDAVYVELGGSHSHRTETDNQNATKNLVSNLIEAKQTLDVKIDESEMQMFTNSEKIKSKDVKEIGTADADVEIESDSNDSESPAENSGSDSETSEEREKSDHKSSDSESEDVEMPSKTDKDNVDLTESLTDELNQLRSKDFTKLKEEVIIDDEGRKRRKVIFPENNSDGDITQENSSNRYVPLRIDKNENIHNKISETLKMLDNIEKSKTFEENDFSSDESENDSDDEEFDRTSDSKNKKNLSGNVNQNDASGNESDSGMSVDNIEDESSSNENEDDNDESLKWKENLTKKAQDAFIERQQNTENLMKLVYDIFNDRKMYLENSKDTQNQVEEEEVGGLFKVVSGEQKRKQHEKDTMNLPDVSLFTQWDLETRDWLQDENKCLIENCFVTGKWKKSEDAEELLHLDNLDDDSDVFDDFEDLETGVKHMVSDQLKAKKQEKNQDDQDENTDKPESSTKETLAEKKRRLKEKFDSEYDNKDEKSYYDDLKLEAEKQSKLNKSVFEELSDDVRVQLEGFRPGMYVRIEFQKLPYEFIENFDPTYPVLVGALNMAEENIGYVNVKIKKHRWYKRILKTQNPLIISLGWRRFQTIPLFSKLEDDLKYRFLKYTPEHVVCNAHFWGPITPQGTGFLAIQDCTDDNQALKAGFRIAATGSVQELDKSTQIMKKLKLIGEPLKIYKKTAFIKGMFTSALEVAKFEGARIKTVSGIRGIIKKAVRKPEGCFRASFEDKILLSDIVFCRTWFKVDVPQFYNPITNLLLPLNHKNKWSGMKTVGQLKREQGIQNEPNFDSLYTEIQRNPKVFKPLIIPKKLQAALPFRDKPKRKHKSEQKYDRVAVIREPHEQKVMALMKRLRTTYDAKQDQLKKATSARMEKRALELKDAETSLAKKIRESKKQVCRNKSKTALARERREARRNKKDNKDT